MTVSHTLSFSTYYSRYYVIVSESCREVSGCRPTLRTAAEGGDLRELGHMMQPTAHSPHAQARDEARPARASIVSCRPRALVALTPLNATPSDHHGVGVAAAGGEHAAMTREVPYVTRPLCPPRPRHVCT